MGSTPTARTTIFPVFHLLLAGRRGFDLLLIFVLPAFRRTLLIVTAITAVLLRAIYKWLSKV